MTSTERCEFLPDPVRGLNQSYVFIKWWPTDEIGSTEDAMRYLRNRAPIPVHLSPLQRDKNLTVVVRASENPRIEFGRSVPSGKWEDDFDEIVSVVKANGIEATR